VPLLLRLAWTEFADRKAIEERMAAAVRDAVLHAPANV
jgi:hypothetical protein